MTVTHVFDIELGFPVPGLDALAENHVSEAELAQVADRFCDNIVEGVFYRHAMKLVEPMTDAGLNFTAALHLLENLVPDEQASAAAGLFHDRLLQRLHEQFLDQTPSQKAIPSAFRRASDEVIQAVCQDLGKCDEVDTGHLPPLPQDRGLVWNAAMLLNSMVLDIQKHN